MTVNVSPTTSIPTHHVSLSDGISTVGLILRSAGRVDPRAISRRPRQNGQSSPFTQSDFGGGRGIDNAASDRSRYADAKRMITRHTNTAMISGQETYTSGYRSMEQYMPGKLTWTSLLTTTRYIAYKFTCSATGNRGAIYLWIRRRGTPTSTLTVELCSDSTGNPGAVLKTVTKTTTNITDTVSELVEFAFSSVQAVTSTTAYWVKIYTSSADSSTNYWQVGTDAARTNALTKDSSDNGSTDAWAASTFDLYFRVVDDTDLLGGLFFTYKRALYFLTRPSGAAAPKLYINGARGVATGTHSTTTLQDTTQTFTVDALIGSTVLIIEGTNSEWQTPYRTITDNDANTITFSPAFPKAPVSNDTIYVIVGSNVWTEITGHGLTVLPTATTSSGDICYFAQGDFTRMRRMREYLANGVWTREFAEELNTATFLCSYRHPSKGLIICKAQNAGNSGQPVFAQAIAETWGQRLRFPLLWHDCEDTTSWTFGANVTGSNDATIFTAGKKSVKMVKIAGSATTTPFAYIAYTQYSINLQRHTAIRFWIYAGGARPNDIKIRFSQATDCSTSIQEINVPAFPADTWVQLTVPFDDSLAEMRYMTSIGFISASNYTLYIDGIEMVPAGSEVLLGNKGEKITGLEVYGDPEVPWVFRTQSAGSVENGIFNPIPLKEISTAESTYNGMGHTVHNVYLYFSFLHGIERFYRNNLDDVGPNREEGLPDGRRGYVTSMVGYIGRFFYNYDVQEGYSCIFESTSGTDHHEVYRSDVAGKRIRNLFVQVIPGDTADRLWFTEGDDVAWLPLPGNTLKENTDDTFLHTHEGVLETGWLYGTEQDAVKIYHSVKLFTENLTSNRKIEWDYKTDGNTTWTPVTTAFTSSPVQEIVLDVSCKRIKFRFRLQTNDNTETPIIKTMFVSATTRPETRWTYSMSTLLEDNPIDLQGNQDTSLTAAEVLTILDGWMEANTILTLRSTFTPYDNKQVILEPVVTQPVTLIIDESMERLSATVVLLEP